MIVTEIEKICTWSSPKFITNSRGLRVLRTSVPTEAFWAVWNKDRAGIKALGIDLRRESNHDGSVAWTLLWWQDPTPAVAAPVIIVPPPVVMTTPSSNGMKWSSEQEAIFTWFRTGTGSLVVRARAGTGKTTTIKAALAQAPEDRMVYLVFNKKNQVEATAAITDCRVEVKTLHSLGFLFIQQVWPNVKPTDDVEKERIDQAVGVNVPSEVKTQVRKLVGFAKNTLLTPTLADMIDLAEVRDIECPGFESPLSGGWTVEKLCAAAMLVLDLSRVRDPLGRISFNDMVWLPVVMGWVRSWYDLVVVDECFPGDTHVLLADGTSLPIGQIVENRIPVSVLSFDEQTGRQVAKPVTDFKKIVLRKKTYRVKVQQIVQGINGPWNITRSRIQLGGRTIVCTEGHKIWTTRGWVAVENLLEGDHVQVECQADAVVLAVEEHEIDDTFVYDLTVDGTHCYYANGVLVHNCQDMSRPQLLMAKAAMKEGGRVCVVGDDRQAIYGFRGAAQDGMDMMKTTLNATELGLTITYRCPKAVVAIASTIVPDYKAADSAPEGLVDSVAEAMLPVQVKIGDAILSRSNAPLMPLCLGLLRKGIPTRIEGRDIGKALLDIVKKLNAKTVPQFITRLENWGIKQTARFEGSKRFEEKAAEISDQVDTLSAVAEGASSVKEVETRLTNLFEDTSASSKPAVILSSTHKSKGLEWEHVFLLRSTFNRKRPENSAPQNPSVAAAQAKEEANIYYVAVTRAKSVLTMVDR